MHHCLKRGERTLHVVAIVANWIAHRIGHRQPRREVHDGRGAALPDGPPDRIDVSDVADDERRIERRLPMAR
jgi:hypothetical protein